MRAIAAEEADYKNHPLPKFYVFESREERERILYNNFVNVTKDVKAMIASVLGRDRAI